MHGSVFFFVDVISLVGGGCFLLLGFSVLLSFLVGGAEA